MTNRIHTNKKYLALFYDRCETLKDNYTDAEIGEIMRAAIEYELYGKEPELSDRALSVMCRTICNDIDIMTDRANKRSRQNSDNARNRWSRDRDMTPEEIDAEIDAMFPRRKTPLK